MRPSVCIEPDESSTSTSIASVGAWAPAPPSDFHRGHGVHVGAAGWQELVGEHLNAESGHGWGAHPENYSERYIVRFGSARRLASSTVPHRHGDVVVAATVDGVLRDPSGHDQRLDVSHRRRTGEDQLGQLFSSEIVPRPIRAEQQHRPLGHLGPPTDDPGVGLAGIRTQPPGDGVAAFVPVGFVLGQSAGCHRLATPAVVGGQAQHAVGVHHVGPAVAQPGHGEALGGRVARRQERAGRRFAPTADGARPRTTDDAFRRGAAQGIGRGSRRGGDSTPTAASAAPCDASSERGMLDTPSHTERTKPPSSPSSATVKASSLRTLRGPLSDAAASAREINLDPVAGTHGPHPAGQTEPVPVEPVGPAAVRAVPRRWGGGCHRRAVERVGPRCGHRPGGVRCRWSAPLRTPRRTEPLECLLPARGAGHAHHRLLGRTSLARSTSRTRSPR